MKTVLHIASAEGQLELVKTLLKKKRETIDYQDADGLSPLHYSVRSNKLEVSKELLNQGANPNIQSNDGETPMHFLVKHSHTPETLLNILRLFLDKGANAHALTNRLESPLHVSVATENLVAVKLLFIECSVDINAQNKEGETPLHLAARNGNIEVIKYLLQLGGSTNIVTDHGATAKKYAEAAGHLMIAAMLFGPNDHPRKESKEHDKFLKHKEEDVDSDDERDTEKEKK